MVVDVLPGRDRRVLDDEEVRFRVPVLSITCRVTRGDDRLGLVLVREDERRGETERLVLEGKRMEEERRVLDWLVRGVALVRDLVVELGLCAVLRVLVFVRVCGRAVVWGLDCVCDLERV